MKTIEERLTSEVNSLNKKFINDSTSKSFEDAIQTFDELVSKGVVERRGNNLLSSSEAHTIMKVSYNHSSSSE